MNRERYSRAFALAATEVWNELSFDMGNEGNFNSFADIISKHAAFDPVNLDVCYSIFYVLYVRKHTLLKVRPSCMCN